MSYNLYIITGIYGSGKTTYCQNKNINMLSIDDITNYDTQTINYTKITEWIEQTRHTHSYFYLDGYPFEFDPNLDKLTSILVIQTNIYIIHLFADSLQLYRQAYQTKWRNGVIFIELSKMNDTDLANHIRQKLLDLIKLTHNYHPTYLCRSTNNTIKPSNINELLLFMNKLI